MNTDKKEYTKEYKKKYIKGKFNDINVRLTDVQIEQFVEYYEVLTEWNSFMNLTAITEFEEVVLKHFVDSVAVINVMDIEKVSSVIDIGTGAGFPGIPLKIVFPHLKITLLDSLNKRVKFLNEVIDHFQLKNIFAIHGRAEEYAKNIKYREKYDLCVSRAVANLASLSEYCMAYVKLSGYFIPYKSGEIGQEVDESKKAISVMGGKVGKILKFELPGTDIGRSFVVIRKKKMTPKKYPRKAGTPTREPIK